MKKLTISFPVTVTTKMVQKSKNIIIYYPMIHDLKSHNVELLINHSIVEVCQELINKQFSKMTSPVVEMIGHFEIKNNQRDILSLTLSNYTYHDHAAHGMTYLRSLTFNTKSGKRYKLADLFKPDCDYVRRISRLIKKQITKRDMTTLSEFNKIKPDQEFYIADKSLVIYFQLYDLVPYVYGIPMFPISVYDLQDMVVEDGPLGRMILGT